MASPQLRDALGPKPAEGATAELWTDAAGRAMQHETAFRHAPAPATLRESMARQFGDDPYATSHRAMVEARERLDRTLGQELEIEPPHRALGLSL